uniref:Uncharacterized protein n=1 Tax=Oryza punctata TaxID=4537 RepID=A0A0E0LW30_ORYPU
MEAASLLPAAASHTVRRKRGLQLNETVYEEPEYVATKDDTAAATALTTRSHSSTVASATTVAATTVNSIYACIPTYLIGRKQTDREEVAVVPFPLVEANTIAEAPVISMDDDGHPTSPTSPKVARLAVHERPKPKLRVCSMEHGGRHLRVPQRARCRGPVGHCLGGNW